MATILIKTSGEGQTMQVMSELLKIGLSLNKVSEHYEMSVNQGDAPKRGRRSAEDEGGQQ